MNEKEKRRKKECKRGSKQKWEKEKGKIRPRKSLIERIKVWKNEIKRERMSWDWRKEERNYGNERGYQRSSILKKSKMKIIA